MDLDETADTSLQFTAHLWANAKPVFLPEVSLVAAVFQDAVRCAQRAGRGVTHQQASEALDWFASERCDWPFAFVNVCDVLGVNAEAVRERLHVGHEDRPAV